MAMCFSTEKSYTLYTETFNIVAECEYNILNALEIFDSTPSVSYRQCRTTNWFCLAKNLNVLWSTNLVVIQSVEFYCCNCAVSAITKGV